MPPMAPMMQKQPTLTTDDQLLAVLERARTVGFLGPGPLRVHLDHARTFGHLIPSSARTLVDLGSGGGLPGLPLLADRPELSGVLLDAATKRTAFLVWATTELELQERVSVVTARAEDAAHRAELRGSFDVVVCRGFGPPAVTIECSAGFVADDGRLLISEPPAYRSWDNDVLASIGLEHQSSEHGVAVFARIGATPMTTPRSAKRMQNKPLKVRS